MRLISSLALSLPLSILLTLATTSALAQLAAPLAPGELVWADSQRQWIYRVDPATGDRSNLTGCHGPCVGSGPALGQVELVAIESATSVLASPWNTEDILRVDVLTGNRSVFSSSTVGSGPLFQSLTDISVAPNGAIYATDGVLDAVLEIDAISGDRTIVSGPGVGTGPIMYAPNDIAIVGGKLIVADLSQGIVSIDPTTGNRTVVERTGASVSSAYEVARETDSTVLIGDRDPINDFEFHRLDLTTGVVQTISSSTSPPGPPALDETFFMAFDALSGRFYTSDWDNSSPQLIEIAPTTGARLILSDPTTGSGLQNLRANDVAVYDPTQLPAVRAVPGLLPVVGAFALIAGAITGGRAVRNRADGENQKPARDSA